MKTTDIRMLQLKEIQIREEDEEVLNPVQVGAWQLKIVQGKFLPLSVDETLKSKA